MLNCDAEHYLFLSPKTILLTLLFLFGFATIEFSQASNSASLFITKCKTGEDICDTQEIVRYDFVDGTLKTQEKVFSSKTSYVRFELGPNTLIDNHLLITSSGDVIDLKTQKVIYHSDGQLIGIFGSRIYVDVDRIDDDDIYSFDLKSNKTERIRSRVELEDLEYLNEKAFSPNGEFVAKWAGSTGFQFFKVRDGLKFKRTKTVYGQFSAVCSNRCSDNSGRVPYIWIDNSRILTQSSNGKLISINTSGKIEKFADINVTEPPDSLPYFGNDRFGNIFYSFDGTDYLIDVTNKRVSIDRIPLGNGFALKNGEIFWSDYFYNNELIGKIWSGGALTGKNYIAVLYAKEGKNLGYPDGIKIWNTSKKEWLTIEVPWSVKLIEWIEN